MMTLLLASIVFWTEPQSVATIDFSRPARSVPAPLPPFSFQEEDKSGTSAKVLIRDAAGITWQVKGGPEARAESFATRFVSALGYYADSVVFLAKGTFQQAPATLGRASGFINSDGTFTWASFERRDPEAKFLSDRHWKWTDVHTREVHGLRIVMMLLSNWDNKDARNSYLGPNTGYIETRDATHAYVTDWGQSLGGWGRFFGRSNWDCDAYKKQTRTFVSARKGGRVRFSFVGQHTTGFADNLTVEDVRWIMKYLGQITDAQIHTGLLASGASPEEENCFAHSLRARIETLRRIAALR